MSLYKRGNTWWVRFTSPSGEVVRRSSKSTNKKEASEFHDRLKALYWRKEVIGETRYTWNQATGRFLEEFCGKSRNDVVIRLRWLHQHLDGRYIDELTRDYIYKVTEIKAKDSSNSTANRYSALVRVILRKCAFEWEWLSKAPKIRMRPEPKRRVRYLTEEEAWKLIRELPSHQRGMATLAWHTGLRMSNVTQLKWEHIDMQTRTIVVPDTKNGEPLGVYINQVALEVIRNQIGKHQEYVFVYKGNPVKQCSTKAWKKAKERAGIKDFRWHDLRHTWASHHVQNNTPLYALQEQAGWKSPGMVRRYAHLSASDFAKHGESLAQNRAQSKKEAK